MNADEVVLTKELQPRNQKSTAVAMFAAMFGLLLLSVVLAVLLFLELGVEETDHLGEFSDPVVLNRVPGYQGPTARMGDIITYRGERCALRSTTIESRVFYSATDPTRTVAGDTVKSDVLEGCFAPTQSIAMPEGVHTGVWSLSGIVRDTKSGEVRFWTSETFQVVP